MPKPSLWNQTVETRLSSLEQGMKDMAVQLQKLQQAMEIHPARNEEDAISKRFANSISSVIGLQEAVTSRSLVVRCVWIMLLITSTGSTVYFVYKTAEEYLNEPSATKVTLEHHATYEYPPVVVCTESWFDVEKAITLGMSTDALKYAFGFVTPPFDLDSISLSNVSKGREEFYQFFNSSNYTNIIDLFKAITVDIIPAKDEEEIIDDPSDVSLHFGLLGQPVEKILVKSGVCFSLKLPLFEESQSPPFFNLFIRIGDKTRGIGNAKLDKTLTLYFSKDFHTAELDPIKLKPFTDSSIKVRTVKYKALYKEDKPCAEKGDVSNDQTRLSCMADCIFNHRFTTTGCYDVIHVAHRTSPHPILLCNHYNETLRPAEAMAIHKKARSECSSNCLGPCEKTMHDSSLTFQDNLKAYDDLRARNLTVVRIMFSHEASRLGGVLFFNEVSTYSFITLVNNVGGTLGLFLGCTVMTLAQIILFFIDYALQKQCTGNVSP